MPDEHQRIALLNWLVNRSTTRSRTHDAPLAPMDQLLGILGARLAKGWAIEFWRGKDSSDEAERLKLGAGCDFIRLSDMVIDDTREFRYVTLLLKYADMAVKGFAVEDVQQFTGREIEGNEYERGVVAAHLSFRLPLTESQLDVGKYRCVVESVPTLTRGNIEHFLCRQIRRHTDAEEWTFSVIEQKRRRSKPTTKEIHYTPRLELHADVGRKLDVATPGEGSGTTQGSRSPITSLPTFYRSMRCAYGPEGALCIRRRVRDVDQL
jgi:hypothetical protein